MPDLVCFACMYAKTATLGVVEQLYTHLHNGQFLTISLEIQTNFTNAPLYIFLTNISLYLLCSWSLKCNKNSIKQIRYSEVHHKTGWISGSRSIDLRWRHTNGGASHRWIYIPGYGPANNSLVGSSIGSHVVQMWNYRVAETIACITKEVMWLK